MTTDRVSIIRAVAFIALAILSLQLVRIQVFNADQYRQAAAEQQLRALPVEPPRGVITDRHGEILAQNRPAFSVTIVPAELPSDANSRRALLLQVERDTETRFDALDAAIRAGEQSTDPFAAIRVRSGLGLEQAVTLRVALAGLSGVRVEASPMRVYEGGDLLSSILGYIGPIEPEQVATLRARGYPLDALLGQSGVESVYEATLRGSSGRLLIAADVAGRDRARLGSVAATPGADVLLSIDTRLQRAATDALRDGITRGLPPSGRSADGALARAAGAAGAAIVMDVRSGEVLAMASLPSYDANIFSGTTNSIAVSALLANPARPLLNRAYMEVRAPGSIFKPIVGLAALQEGIATTETKIRSTGALVVANQYDHSVKYIFRDWAAHGLLDFNGAMARSSDVYFYYLSGGFEQFKGLGSDRVAKYARAFGLGSATGIDLPGEAEGLVPDDAWKQRAIGDEWLLGDTYTFGIGQGYLTATPLQMAVVCAALANGGDVLVPRMVAGTRSAGTIRATERRVRGRLPAEARHIETIRASMLATASVGGTATEGKPATVNIGAKTGTAEFGQMFADGSYDSHGWYMAFGPYEQPEIAVVVYLEHGVGATHAGPVARQILEAYFGGHAQGTAAGAR